MEKEGNPVGDRAGQREVRDEVELAGTRMYIGKIKKKRKKLKEDFKVQADD